MTIRDLLEARTRALAAEMATTPTVLHLQAAAQDLTTELRRELDALMAAFRPAGGEVTREAAPAIAAPSVDAPAADALSVDASSVDGPAAEAAASDISGPAGQAEVAS